MSSQQSDKPTKRKCRIPRKLADVFLLFFGILLAMCLQYLSPSIRFVANEMWYWNIGLCQRIQSILAQYYVAENREAIKVVVIATVILVIIIVFIVGFRHDKDDDIIDKLTEINRNTSNIVSALGIKERDNHAEKETSTKAQTTEIKTVREKTNKAKRQKGGKTQDN